MSDSRIFIFELNETEHRFPDLQEALEFLNQIAHMERVDLWAKIDLGPRRMPWYERIVGIRADRDIEQCFHLEKAGGAAKLIFFDDAFSEYRALDPDHPVQASVEERLAVSQGELAPAPIDECVHSDRALKAAAEYLQLGKRPEWLTYRYVK